MPTQKLTLYMQLVISAEDNCKFGFLFLLIRETKKTFEIMEIDTLAKEESLSETILHPL